MIKSQLYKRPAITEGEKNPSFDRGNKTAQQVMNQAIKEKREADKKRLKNLQSENNLGDEDRPRNLLESMQNHINFMHDKYHGNENKGNDQQDNKLANPQEEEVKEITQNDENDEEKEDEESESSYYDSEEDEEEQEEEQKKINNNHFIDGLTPE